MSWLYIWLWDEDFNVIEFNIICRLQSLHLEIVTDRDGPSYPSTSMNVPRQCAMGATGYLTTLTKLKLLNDRLGLGGTKDTRKLGSHSFCPPTLPLSFQAFYWRKSNFNLDIQIVKHICLLGCYADLLTISKVTQEEACSRRRIFLFLLLHSVQQALWACRLLLLL